MQPALAASPREWAQRTDAALTWSLQAQHWTPSGSLRSSEGGARSIVALRIAIGRIAWGNDDLNAAARDELRGLVAALSRIAELRLADVSAAGGNPVVTARAKYHLYAGDRLFPTNPEQASYHYVLTWKRLVGLEPTDAPLSEIPVDVIFGPDDGVDGQGPYAFDSQTASTGSGTSGSGGGTTNTGSSSTSTKLPVVTALPVIARADRSIALKYRLTTDRETREELWVQKGRTVIARFRRPFASRSTGVTTLRLQWLRRSGRFSFCVRAHDRNGMSSDTSCAPLEIRFVVRAIAARGDAGGRILLRYRVPRATPTRAVVEIRAGSRRLATLTTKKSSVGTRTIVWRAPSTLAGRRAWYCVIARTSTGERSIRSCARILLRASR